MSGTVPKLQSEFALPGSAVDSFLRTSQDVIFTTSQSLVEARLEVTTPSAGVSPTGSFTTAPGGLLALSRGVSGATARFTFTLPRGKGTLAPGRWLLASQLNTTPTTVLTSATQRWRLVATTGTGAKIVRSGGF